MRHTKSALIFSTALASALAVLVGAQVVAGPQQGQQPPPPVTGGGQAIEGTGITQGIPPESVTPEQMEAACNKAAGPAGRAINIDEPRPGGSPQQTQPPLPNPINVAIPPICLAASGAPGALSASCDVVGGVELGIELSKPFGKPDQMWEMGKILAKYAAEKAVVYSLKGLEKGVSLDPRIDLLKEYYSWLVKFDAYMWQRVNKELMENGAHAEWLKQQAYLHSQSVQALVCSAFTQQKSVVEAAQNYLTANPNTPAIQFNCGLACQQLIAAGQGLNVFDNPPGTSNAQSAVATRGGQIAEPPKHNNTGWIVGGVLAGAGAAGAAAALSMNKGCGSSPASQVNQACFGGNSSACQQAIAQMNSYCQCNGFSGFSVSTGSCQ